MKKLVTKKLLLTLSGLCLFAGGLIYAAGPQIFIDPTRFVSQQKIQQVNLNSSGENTIKEGLVNKGVKKPVLLIGNVSGDVVKQVNSISGEINSVIGGTGNVNSGNDETSFIAGGFLNLLNNTLSSIILGGSKNETNRNNSVILASSGVKLNVDGGVAIGLSNSEISGNNSIGLIGNNVSIGSGANDSVAIGSNITVETGGMFIFNGNGGTSNLKGNLENSVLIRSDHGLVIGGQKMVTGNKSNSIRLTVHGGVSLGSGQCNTNTSGAVYYTVGTTEKGGQFSCVCFCASSGATAVKSIAVSNQPYCDVACKNTEDNGNRLIDGSGKCGNGSSQDRGFEGTGENISVEGKEMVYEHWEFKWRANSKFCLDGSRPEVGTIDNHHSGDVQFPGTGEVVSWVCPGLTAADDSAQCNAYRKEAPHKCGENAKEYYLNDTGYLIKDDEIGFCEQGNFFGIGDYNGVPYEGYAFPSPGNTVKWGCKTNSGHVNAIETGECLAYHKDCNHCAVNGFPYCFDINFEESCPDVTGETPGNGLVTLTCPAPTITSVEGKTVYFNLNGASVSTVLVCHSKDGVNWIDCPAGSPTSPRTIGANYATGYVKLMVSCGAGITSESNVVMFGEESSGGPSSCSFPEMHIDSIQNCKLVYHFNEFTPPQMQLWYKRPGASSFSPYTTTIQSPLIGAVPEGMSGTISFKYKYQSCPDEFSPEYTYTMEKQTGCSGGGSYEKMFYNNVCLDWDGNGLYREDANGRPKKLGNVSAWYWQGYGSTYNYTYPDTNKTATVYEGYYLSVTDNMRLYDSTVSYPLITYIPCPDGQRCKLKISSDGKVLESTTHGVGNLKGSCSN